jgi:hypothetical protein
MSVQSAKSSIRSRSAALIRRAAPIIAAACGASMLTLALRPSNPVPADKSADVQSVLAAPGDNLLDRRGEGFRDMRLAPVSDADFTEAERFFTEYSPTRINEIRVADNEQRRTNLRRVLVYRYRALQKVKSESLELYDTQLREVKANDDVFRICLELKRGGRDRKALQSELNARVTDLFNLGLADRKIRITQVEKSLGDQKILLEHDESNKVMLATKQYERILTQGVEGARLDNTRRMIPAKPKAGSTTAPSNPGDISPGESQSQ